jgi:hypothetical protein
MEVFMDRRNFLKAATVAAAGSVAPAGAQSPTSSVAARRPESPNMIYRELGRTGEHASAIGMGGYHIGKQQDPDESIRLLRAASGSFPHLCPERSPSKTSGMAGPGSMCRLREMSI